MSPLWESPHPAAIGRQRQQGRCFCSLQHVQQGCCHSNMRCGPVEVIDFAHCGTCLVGHPWQPSPKRPMLCCTKSSAQILLALWRLPRRMPGLDCERHHAPPSLSLLHVFAACASSLQAIPGAVCHIQPGAAGVHCLPDPLLLPGNWIHQGEHGQVLVLPRLRPRRHLRAFMLLPPCGQTEHGLLCRRSHCPHAYSANKLAVLRRCAGHGYRATP